MKHDRLYYTQMFFDTVLPQITEITTQSRYGYHGLSHTIQVALFGIDLAQHINQDALPVLLAAGLHDCARASTGIADTARPTGIHLRTRRLFN